MTGSVTATWEGTSYDATFELQVGVVPDLDLAVDIDWCNGWFCTDGPELRYFMFQAGTTAYAEAIFTAGGAADVDERRELFGIDIARAGTWVGEGVCSAPTTVDLPAGILTIEVGPQRYDDGTGTYELQIRSP